MSESMSKSARGDDVVLLPTSHYMFAMVDFAVAGGPGMGAQSLLCALTHTLC